MINYVPINRSNDKIEISNAIKQQFSDLRRFRYTHEFNVHAVFDFKCPTKFLGKYECMFFIDVPYKKGNYSRIEGNKVKSESDFIYINTLAIAIRTIEDLDVIDCDDNWLITKEGSWDYQAEIESDRAAMRNFVYDSLNNVRHFDIAVVYKIKAPNCSRSYNNDVLYVNSTMNLDGLIDYAISKTFSTQSTDCLLFKDDKKSAVWADFIPKFIEASEAKTKQGILTQNKVNAITEKINSKLIARVYDALGDRLCIIRGAAGTGKTRALIQVMHNMVKPDSNNKAHHCRLLTFNNMLVLDLRQIMKGIGNFNATNVSISSLHKFFFDIYLMSPVRVLHMDQSRIDKLFALCYARVSKYNAKLLSNPSLDDNTESPKEKNSKEDEAEIRQYKKYLKDLKFQNRFVIDDLDQYAKIYVERKKHMFEENYHRQEFLNGYNIIIKQLYLVFHNLDEFIHEYGMKTAYTSDELRKTDAFRAQYEQHYDEFIKNAEDRFQKESLATKALVHEYMEQINALDATNINVVRFSENECKEQFKESLKKIKRKVNWSKYIIVDEAQDCSEYEKALLLELNGSADTLVSSGGRDQLIRTPRENDWTKCFGSRLENEHITLSRVSHRQKGNIVLFLNAFAESFKLDTELSISDDMVGKGRIIIDCRNSAEKSIPEDVVNALHLSGIDHGCSNYENMMFLFPQSGYVQHEKSDEIEVVIDENNTITEKQASAMRSLRVSMPKYLNVVDGTVNDKREVLASTGQDNTRCILYESCRGLEAWNVLCFDMDEFYNNKASSMDAEDYASEHAGLLFESDLILFKQKYAALWCYMSMTRAVDTLYIKLANINSPFSRELLKSVQNLQFVEILSGERSN